MKLFLKTINILCFIILIFLLVGLITSEDYKDVIFIAPIFFKELIIVLLAFFSVVLVYFVLRKPESNSLEHFIFLIIRAFFSFRISYLSHPIVKMDILFERMVEFAPNEDAFNEAKGIHEKNGSLEYFYILNKEVEMFRSIYELQFNYLKERNAFINPNFDSQFLFFLILGVFLIGIGLIQVISDEDSN